MEVMAEDWDNCCPLCMEEMDPTDRQLKPCRCGYQICVWCWNHIMEMAEKDNSEGRCPACRAPYNKEKIVATSCRSMDINDRKQKSGKSKLKSAEGRKNLSNVRVIQRKLVYVVGMPATVADEETLERKEYFGQYGKILKISVSKLNGQNSQHSSASPSASVYVTYMKEEDALRCIQAVNGFVLEGKVLKACFGTTKYCNAWLKHMPCNNPECLYLHDEGTREDSFTKEEMLANYGSKSQHFQELMHPAQRRSGVFLPPPLDANPVASTSQPTSIPASIPKVSSAAGSLPKSSSLPAAASWGSRSNTSSRVTSAGKTGVGAAIKPKATSSSLLMASADHGSGQIAYNNSYDPVKPNITDEGQGCVPRQLTRTADPPCSQTEASFTALDTLDIGVEFPRPASDRTSSDSRKPIDATVNHLDTSNIDMLEYPRPESNRASSDSRESSDVAANHLYSLNIDMELTRPVTNRAPPSHSRKSSDVAVNHLCDTSNIDMEIPVPVSNMPSSHSRKSSYDVDVNNVDGLNIDVEFPRPVSDRDFYNSRKSNDVDISNRTFSSSSKLSDVENINLNGGVQEESQSKSSVSQNFVDAEENETGINILAEKDSSTENYAISPVVVGIVDEHSSRGIDAIEVPMNTKIFPYGSSSVSSHLFADAETSNHTSENDSKQMENHIHLQPDTHISPKSNDSRFQTPAIDGLTVSTSQITVLSENPWLDSATNDQSLELMKDEIDQVSRGSLIEKDKLTKLERDQISEEPINGHREHELITDMFATGFDLWTDGNPQDLAQLLFNGENVDLPSQVPVQEPLPSWQSSSTKQSRFHFARQDHATSDTSLSSNCDFQASGHDRWIEKQHTSLNNSASNTLDEISTGESFRNKFVCSGEPFATSSKAVVGAPPGFSAIRVSAAPPPGFSQYSWPSDPRRNAESSHDPPRSLVASSIYNQLEPTNIGTNDVEFIDPAIMAVGKGKLESGVRSTMHFGSSPALPGFVSQAAPMSQQPKLADYDANYQTSQERSYRSYGSMNSVSQHRFSNQDRSSLSSFFQSSLNDLNKQTLPGQYRDSMNFQLQDSVYGNGTTKPRYQPTEWDDWKRLSEVNSTAHQSVNDAVGRFTMSQMSLDRRVLQSRYEEFALTKELASKYYADAAIREEQGQFSNARVGRYYLQN